MSGRAWLDNGANWLASASAAKNGYRFIDARNSGYVTSSVAVPIPDLMNAVSQAMVIGWSA